MPGNQKGERRGVSLLTGATIRVDEKQNICASTLRSRVINPVFAHPRRWQPLTPPLSFPSARASLPGVRRRLQVAAQLRRGGRHRAPAGLRPHRTPLFQPGAPGSPGAAEEGPSQGQDDCLHLFTLSYTADRHRKHQIYAQTHIHTYTVYDYAQAQAIQFKLDMRH